MIFDNFEVSAQPFFHKVRCPKHGNDMLEIANGWFSVVWYCEKCKYPYHIKLLKMTSYNKERLEEAVKEKVAKESKNV